jgi:hypothetical protein
VVVWAAPEMWVGCFRWFFFSWRSRNLSPGGGWCGRSLRACCRLSADKHGGIIPDMGGEVNKKGLKK